MMIGPRSVSIVTWKILLVSICMGGGCATASSCHGSLGEQDGWPRDAGDDQVVTAPARPRRGPHPVRALHAADDDGGHCVALGRPAVEAEDLAGGRAQQGEADGATGPAAEGDLVA